MADKWLSLPTPALWFCPEGASRRAPIYVVLTAKGPVICSSGLLRSRMDHPEFMEIAFSDVREKHYFVESNKEAHSDAPHG